MTDTRKEVLDLLADLSNLRPEMRLGQWLLMFLDLVRSETLEAVYEVEDEELIPAMRDFLAKRHTEAMNAADWMKQGA